MCQLGPRLGCSASGDLTRSLCLAIGRCIGERERPFTGSRTTVSAAATEVWSGLKPGQWRFSVNGSTDVNMIFDFRTFTATAYKGS